MRKLLGNAAMLAICVALCLLLTGMTRVAQADELDFHSFNGHMYAVIGKSMTWHEAKAYCESLGCHLVTITSEAEQLFIQSIISSKNHYWLGATDEKQEGVWEWVTGETWSYANWSRGQPDNAGGVEHYLHITSDQWGRDYFSKWNDVPSNWGEIVGLVCEWGANVVNIR